MSSSLPFDSMMEQLDKINDLIDQEMSLLQKMIDDLGGPVEETVYVPEEEPLTIIEMEEVQNIINQCYIENGVIKLPSGQLDRKVYEQVKKKLEGIGGKWKGGKTQGFEYPHDPTDLLTKIQEGEAINLKKDYQFFPTPDHIAAHMVELAEIKPGNDILEPSAGQGAIVRAILDATQDFKMNDMISISVCEAMPQNITILRKEFFEDDQEISIPTDFLEVPLTGMVYYDRIIANPPFTKGQDIDHIMHMLRLGKPLRKFVVVSLSSPSWLWGQTKKVREFRDLVFRTAEYIEYIQPGEFKKSGTEIATVLIKFAYL